MKLYLGKHDEVSSLEELLEKLPDNTFASPRRSTLPLLDFWRTPESRLRDLSRSLGLPALDDATLSFEYPVEVRAGRGKASFTDLMITAPNVAIAIEAKHREPTYASCRDWLGDSSEGDNRPTVLGGWLDQINSVAGAQLTTADVMDLPYQLVHRGASLFSVSADQWYLVYQLFEEGERKASVPDLVAFRQLLKGPAGFHVAVMNCQFRPSHDFEPIVRRWDEGERSEGLTKEVREAILRGRIFEFDAPSTRLDG